MSSTVSSAAWLQTAMNSLGGTPTAAGGRHRAPEQPGPVEPLTSEQIARSGRHSAPDGDSHAGTRADTATDAPG
jgi:hypothetical protein